MPGFADIAGEYAVGISIPLATRSTTANGNGVDLRDCGPAVTAALITGTMAGGGPLLDVKLQESKNNNTADASGAADPYTDIAGASFAQLGAADDDVVRLLTVFNRSKRYVRAVGTQSGSATNLSYTCILLAPKTSF